ncbi:hypothetical protein BP6252_02445 [Coleophoma cylindrospora]|uniref:Uncharacterized protein n=1 Tax=Coleophoma cylindrospora TaxID=1849047 RepID=A0A3D8SET8_9HELO|nr:hypothetical protein BP6252_02445 [Coleophoma cylindrospora]
MKLPSIVCCVVWCSEIVLAESHGSTRTSPTYYTKGPLQTITGAGYSSDANNSIVSYSPNWAGVILNPPSSDKPLTSVSGTFAVPAPSVPSGQPDGEYTSSIWLGIDGVNNTNAILQAGIDITITKAGDHTGYVFDAFYEWYPNYAVDFTSFSLTAGDVIAIDITTTSSTSGVIVLENVTTGQSITQSVNAPSSSAPVRGTSAEWVVENFEGLGAALNFSDFGSVMFENCAAGTSSESWGISDASLVRMKTLGGTVLTGVEILGSSAARINYIQ